MPSHDARSQFRARQRRLRLERSARLRRPGDDFLLRHAADDMIDRLSAVQRTFSECAVVFAGSSHLAERLTEAMPEARITRVEETGAAGTGALAASPETPGLASGSYDLVLAPLGIHVSQDLPGTLIQIRRALKPDGLFLGTLPGGGTLQELREALLAAESEITGNATQRVDAFTDIRDSGALLQRAGFALPVADSDTLTVRYGSMFDLVRDLRRMGATFIAEQPRHTGRRVFERAAEIYAERFSDPDGRIRATITLVSMSGWAPHESQQKPLRPGSAKARLADALKTDEKKL